MRTWGSTTSFPARRFAGLAIWAVMRRPADQPGDLGLEDRPPARGTGLAAAPVHGVLCEEAPLQAQNRAVSLVEARPFGRDRPGQDIGNRLVQPADFVAGQGG